MRSSSVRRSTGSTPRPLSKSSPACCVRAAGWRSSGRTGGRPSRRFPSARWSCSASRTSASRPSATQPGRTLRGFSVRAVAQRAARGSHPRRAGRAARALLDDELARGDSKRRSATRSSRRCGRCSLGPTGCRSSTSSPGRGLPELDLQVGRRHVRLTSPDKVLFPGERVTKKDLAEYYAEVGPAIVPHLKDRPFTLKRYPYGIKGQAYFHKQAPKGKPDWLPTRQFRTWPRESKGESRLVDFTLVNEPAAVVWMVQMNCIDMNAWYSRVDKPERPDYVVFDLDPPESRNGFAQAIRVAHLVHEALDELELRSYVKTSGADGIHVLVPIARRYSYPEAYEFAELVSRRPRGREPGARHDRVAEEEAPRRPRRPSPERARQDDRLRVLRPAEAGRAGVDAAALGGARREGAARATSEGARRWRGSRSTATCSSPCSAAARRSGRRCARCAREARGRDRLRAERARGRDHDGSRRLGGDRPRGRGHGRRRRPVGGADAAGLRARRLLRDPSARPRVAVLPRPRASGRLGSARTLRPRIRSTTGRPWSPSARSPPRPKRLGEDGDAYLRLFGRVVSRWSDFEPVVLGPFLPRPNRLLHAVDLSVTRAGLSSAAGLAKRFRSDRARALLAGHAAHSMLPLETRPSGGIGLFLIATAHVFGWGFPRGGAQRLADALADRLEELGGEIRTGEPGRRAASRGRRPGRRRSARAAAHRRRQAARSLRSRASPLPARPRRLQARLGARRPDPVDSADDCRRAATVHSAARSRRSPSRSARPAAERPFVLLTQPSLFDDTRAPSGKHTAWAYCHVPLGSTEDMTEPDRGAGRALRAGLPGPDPRAPRERAGRPRAAQPQHRRRRHQRRDDGPPPAVLRPGAEARPVPNAAEGALHLLLVDARPAAASTACAGTRPRSRP